MTSPAMSNTGTSQLELDGFLTGIVVTPRAGPLTPGEWFPALCGDEDLFFKRGVLVDVMLGPVMKRHDGLVADIDRSLERLKVNGVVDYRPLFLSDDRKPNHERVRTWVRGFCKAMMVTPESWSALVEGERTQILIEPFVGFLDLDDCPHYETPELVEELLNLNAALIPRMILVLRNLAVTRRTAPRAKKMNAAPARKPSKSSPRVLH
jgi:yecA family protein